MKNMRFYSFVLLLLICLVALLTGCSAARKPAEEKRIVVPEVSRVFVETIDLKEAPPEIRDLAKRWEGKDANLALEVDGNVWVVVTRDDEDETVELTEAVERVVSQDAAILEIKLTEFDDKENNKDQAKLLVARLSANSLGSGVVFYSDEEDDKDKERPTAQEENKQTVNNGKPASKTPGKAAGSKAEKESTATFQVHEPKANATIESPVRVTGQARVANSIVAMRLRDSKGNILAETETVAGKDNKFSASLNFTTPKDTNEGRLEVFAPNAPGGSSANTAVIPVTFK